MRVFATRLPYSKKKNHWNIFFFDEYKVKFTTIEDMIKKLQNNKKEKKLIFHQDFSSYYDEMIYIRQSRTFPFEEDSLSKNAQVIAMLIHETFLKKNFLRMKQQLKN